MAETTLTFPVQVEEFSSNWKKLAAKIKESEPPKSANLRIRRRRIARSDPLPSTSNNGVATKPLKSCLKPPIKPVDVERTMEDESDGLTKCVALDCEFVGVGELGKDNMLARVSIVNQEGLCLYDKFVKPREPVIDYRTKVSGVRPNDLTGGEEFELVQKEVCALLDKRVLVGHAVGHDLQVLFLSHPRKKIRDTSGYRPFKAVCHSAKPSLKKLAKAVLGVDIQEGEHNSVVDARTCMQLYNLHRREWEKSLKTQRGSSKKPTSNSKKG